MDLGIKGMKFKIFLEV